MSLTAEIDRSPIQTGTPDETNQTITVPDQWLTISYGLGVAKTMGRTTEQIAGHSLTLNRNGNWLAVPQRNIFPSQPAISGYLASVVGALRQSDLRAKPFLWLTA